MCLRHVSKQARLTPSGSGPADGCLPPGLRVAVSGGLCLAAAITSAAANNWTVSPSAEFKVGYESNVHKVPSSPSAAEGTATGPVAGRRRRVPDTPQSDYFIQPEVSLTLQNAPAMAWHLSAVGFAGRRNYQDEDFRDQDFYGVGLRLRRARETRWDLNVLQALRVVEDYNRGLTDPEPGIADTEDLDIAALRARRRIYEGGVGVGTDLSDKSDISVQYRYNQLTYRVPGLRDRDSHQVRTEWSYALTDKSAFLANATYRHEEQDPLDAADPATDTSGFRGGSQGEALRGLVGLRTLATERVTARAAVGVERYERKPLGRDPLPAPSGTAESATTTGRTTDEAFTWESALTWQAAPKVSVEAASNSGRQLSALDGGNTRQYHRASLLLAYGPTDLITLTLRGIYRRDRYDEPVRVDEETLRRRDELMTLAAGVEYRAPSARWRVYARFQEERVTSTLARSEYDNRQVVGGVVVSY